MQQPRYIDNVRVDKEEPKRALDEIITILEGNN